VFVTAVPLPEPPSLPFGDTDQASHEAQIEAYRRLGGPGRLAAAFRLTDLTRRTSMAGIRARHPSYTPEEVRRALARLVLGDELTRRVWPQDELLDP
jgi:hypothetical protein